MMTLTPDDARRTRRGLLLAAPALILGATPLAAALKRTPRQSEGPFYPYRLPADRDADLTVFNGVRAKGEVIEVVGRVLRVSGQPAAGAVVEIWHCDARGVYAHVGERTAASFQGYGAVKAGADGAYRFRTTRPGVYPGRARHIHVKATPDGGRTLTTQMYFPADAAANRRDFLFRSVRDRDLLVAREEGESPKRYVFDIVVN